MAPFEGGFILFQEYEYRRVIFELESGLLLRDNSCNIYEAGTGVKHNFKHTLPASAQVRFLATKSVGLPRMRPHLRSCCRMFLSRSKSRAAINHLSEHLCAHEVRFALPLNDGRPVAQSEPQASVSLCCKPGRPRFDTSREELRVIYPVTQKDVAAD